MNRLAAGNAVSILMVGFNSREHVLLALGAIGGALRRRNCEVRFVENGDDGTQNLVRMKFPEVIVRPSRGNIGFAAANNYLAEGATGEWLLLLNPDTQLQPEALDILLDQAEAHPEFAVFGGLALDRAGNELSYSTLQFPTPWRLFCRLIGCAAEPGRHCNMPVNEVDAVSGGYMLVRHSVWKELQGLDERFFLYAEELDFCRRAWRRGHRVGHVAASRVLHDVGSGNPHAMSRRMYAMRGIATYYHLQSGTAERYLCLTIQWLTCLSRYLAGLLATLLQLSGSASLRSYREVALKPWTWLRGYRAADEPIR